MVNPTAELNFIQPPRPPKYCAYQRGIYVMMFTTNCASISHKWRRVLAVDAMDTAKGAASKIKEYCDENNLIRCFATPKLARRAWKKWEKRNGRKAPELFGEE